MQDSYDISCGNEGQTDGDGCGGVGSNPINAQKGNLHRIVTDLETFGEAPIRFTRIFNSRTTNFNEPYWDFGNKQTWQHNWNYEVRDLSSYTNGKKDIKIRYPDGREYNFKASDATGSQRVPAADNGDRLYQWTGSTVGHTLVTPDGWEYDFQRTSAPKYQLLQVRNSLGLRWDVTYDANGKILRITNNFGRWIELERTSVGGVDCISRVFSSDGREVTYTYDTWSPTGQPVLAGVIYPDGSGADYTWVGAESLTTGRPLLASASDPMYRDTGAQVRYVYNYDAIYYYGGAPYLVTGTILEERNLITDELIVSLPLGSGSVPQILEGDGTELGRQYVNGLLVSKTDGEGRTVAFTRTAGGYGFIDSVTLPDGTVTGYTRDYAGRITLRIDALGGEHAYVYSYTGFLVSETDELGRTTVTTRDEGNRPVRVDYPDGAYETWSYNADGQVLAHQLRNGGTESFVYYGDGEQGGLRGDLKQRADPLGNVTTYTHTAAGQVASVTDALGRSTGYAYNWRGQLTRETFADGYSRWYEYDEFGNRTAEIDELGNETGYSYNEYNQLASVTDALDRTTTYEYGGSPGCSSCGYRALVTRVTSPSAQPGADNPTGRVVEYVYDGAGQRTAEIRAGGTPDEATTTFRYDPVGRVIERVDPRGMTWRFSYDELGRRISVTDPLGNTTIWTHDGVGNRTSETGADGSTTSWEYDELNREVHTVDPTGQETRRSYDDAGNLVMLTDARGNRYEHTYDLRDQRRSIVYPDGSQEQYDYDGVGNLARYTTRTGQVEQLSYDQRNREVLADWSDDTPDVTRGYDPVGRVTTLSSRISQLSYSYDVTGELLSERQTVAGAVQAHTVGYVYDEDGNRDEVTYPGGSVVIYRYTDRNQVSTLSEESLAPLVSYSYEPGGEVVTKTLANGYRSERDYDDAGRLTRLEHFKGDSSVARFDYGYNSLHHRTWVQYDRGRGDTYQYDPTAQLTQVQYQVTDPAGTPSSAQRVVSYDFDRVGNREGVTDNGTTTSYVANALNQYTAIGGESAGWDGRGNLVRYNGWTYGYDAQNRLISATKQGVGAYFSYDPRNRCVVRTLNGTVTYQYYDGWNVIEERDGSDALKARYIHGPRIDEVVARLTSSAQQYYHEDGLGSVVRVTSGYGNLLEKYTYDAFGAPTIQNSAETVLSSSGIGNRFLFTGREYHSSLKLYDYRNRMYHPALGRFIQTDPIRFDAGDVNLYRYVGNDPGNETDPTGLQQWYWTSDNPPSGVGNDFGIPWNPSDPGPFPPGDPPRPRPPADPPRPRPPADPPRPQPPADPPTPPTPRPPGTPGMCVLTVTGCYCYPPDKPRRPVADEGAPVPVRDVAEECACGSNAGRGAPPPRPVRLNGPYKSPRQYQPAGNSLLQLARTP